MNENFILNGLADDLGFERDIVTRALMEACSASVVAITTDQALEMEDSGNNPKDLFTIAAWSGTGPYPEEIISPKVHQRGGVIHSVMNGQLGFDISINTAGDDDDGFLRAEVSGILPDGEIYPINLTSGNTFVPLPNQSITDQFSIKFINVLKVDVNISISGIVKPPKKETLEQGRLQLKKAGVPVGRAFASLKGMMADMIEAHSDAKESHASKIGSLARRGDPLLLRQAIEDRKKSGKRALKEVAMTPFESFAKIGGILQHEGSGSPNSFHSGRYSGRGSLVRNILSNNTTFFRR